MSWPLGQTTSTQHHDEESETKKNVAGAHSLKHYRQYSELSGPASFLLAASFPCMIPSCLGNLLETPRARYRCTFLFGFVIRYMSKLYFELFGYAGVGINVTEILDEVFGLQFNNNIILLLRSPSLKDSLVDVIRINYSQHCHAGPLHQCEDYGPRDELPRPYCMPLFFIL